MKSRAALVLWFLAVAIAPAQVLTAESRPSVRLAEGLSVRDILGVLSEHSDDSSIAVKLLFASGVEVEGHVQSFNEQVGTCQLLQRDGSVSLVAASDLSAVTIVHAGSAQIALQGNRIFRSTEDPVLTQLAYKRYLKQVGEGKPVALVVDFSDKEINSEDCRFYSEKILKALETISSDIVSQPDGREAFSKVGNSIHLEQRSHEAPIFEHAGSKLRLVFDCVMPLAGNYYQKLSKELKEHL